METKYYPLFIQFLSLLNLCIFGNVYQHLYTGILICAPDYENMSFEKSLPKMENSHSLHFSNWLHLNSAIKWCGQMKNKMLQKQRAEIVSLLKLSWLLSLVALQICKDMFVQISQKCVLYIYQILHGYFLYHWQSCRTVHNLLIKTIY